MPETADDDEDEGVASRGAIGGAANELGSEVRAGIAAWAMAHAARGRALPRLDYVTGVPEIVCCETDDAMDDLAIYFRGGDRLLIQCKASLGMSNYKKSPLNLAIAQVKAQYRTLDAHDHLVIATNSATRGISDLRKALNRRRDPLAGALTNRERSALTKLEQRFTDFSTVDRDLLFERLSILIVSVDELGSGDAGIAAEMLDSHVVAEGYGQPAYRTLCDEFKLRSILRSGLDLSRALDVLGKAGFTLSESISGSPAERLIAEHSAIGRYRADAAIRATSIDLRRLGGPRMSIATFPLNDTMLQPQGAVDRTPIEVTNALRRRGRMLITGAPGSGKSTIVRQLLFHTLDQHAPAILVSLKDVARDGFHGDPLEKASLVAFDNSEIADRGSLNVWMRRAAKSGDLLVLLDALDETHEQRIEAVQWIERLLRVIHPECEVVLTTRAAGYAAAQSLRLREVEVPDFSRASKLQQRVLEAMTPTDLDDDERQNWLNTRLNSLRSHAQFAKTPLTAAVLAILAADGVQEPEPRRAWLLHRLVDKVARSWEHPDELTGRPEVDAADVTLDAFDEIGAAITGAGEPTVDVVKGAVERMLSERWGLAPGPARNLADKCIHFWDEAGFFPISSDGRTVAAPVTQFAELGAARNLIRTRPARLALVALSTEGSYFEVFSLASSLDPATARMVVQIATTERRVDWLTAVGEGLVDSEMDPSDLAELIACLLATPAGSTHVVEIADLLSKLEIPTADQAKVLTWIDSRLAPPSRELFRALALRRWDAGGGREAIREVLWLDPADADRYPDTVYVRKDLAFSAYLEGLEMAVGDLDPTDSVAIAQAGEKSRIGSHRFAIRMENLAADRGITLRPERREELIQFAVAWARDSLNSDRGEAAFPLCLEIIAGLADPMELTRGERRRLDELARLFGALHYLDSPWEALPVAVETRPDAIKDLFELIVGVSDIDPSMLSAEAHAALEECETAEGLELVQHLVTDAPGPITIDRWAIHPLVKIDKAVRLIGTTPWIAAIAGELLLAAPADLQPQIEQEMATQRVTLPPAAHKYLDVVTNALAERSQ